MRLQDLLSAMHCSFGVRCDDGFHVQPRRKRARWQAVLGQGYCAAWRSGLSCSLCRYDDDSDDDDDNDGDEGNDEDGDHVADDADYDFDDDCDILCRSPDHWV